MKSQSYNLETRFNFGKHKGKSLREVINNYESKYIGHLIFYDFPWFILDPETMNFLDKEGFFDNLDMSFYGSGGSFPLNGIVGFNKDYILKQLKKRYEEFIHDPATYEKLAKERFQEYLRINGLKK
jgi:hypothetical protein